MGARVLRDSACPVCRKVGSWAQTRLGSQAWNEAHQAAGILTYIENGLVVCPGKPDKKRR